MSMTRRIQNTEWSKPGKKHPLPIDYLQRIKKPKGRHMRRRGDWGGPLIKNGRMVVIGCRMKML